MLTLNEYIEITQKISSMVDTSKASIVPIDAKTYKALEEYERRYVDKCNRLTGHDIDH